MRSLPGVLVFVLSFAADGSLAARDAAVEAQEGNVDHWIEYYRKERGGSNEPVTKEPSEAAPQPSATDAAKPADRIEQTPAIESVDR